MANRVGTREDTLIGCRKGLHSKAAVSGVFGEEKSMPLLCGSNFFRFWPLNLDTV